MMEDIIIMIVKSTIIFSPETIIAIINLLGLNEFTGSMLNPLRCFFI